ncbi:PIG-X [Pilobolus umbonatus]|nr:PIG-X [Pilobolus umbonatus]
MSVIHSELLNAHSFHPKILTHIPIDREYAEYNCYLDIIYVLPPSVFVDPYQLRDLENSIGAVTVLGEHDLELPLQRVKEMRGSIVFLRHSSISTSSLQIELPIHLRYQQPEYHQDHQNITIEAPYAGWTCVDNSVDIIPPYPPLEDIYSLIPHHPSSAYFIQVKSDDKPLLLSVPVGKAEDMPMVTVGTAVTVMACTLWIIHSIVNALKKRRRSDAKGKRRKSE